MPENLTRLQSIFKIHKELFEYLKRCCKLLTIPNLTKAGESCILLDLKTLDSTFLESLYCMPGTNISVYVQLKKNSFRNQYNKILVKEQI